MLGEKEEADKVAHGALIERYLKKYNNFVEDHSTSLTSILESLSSSVQLKEEGPPEMKKKVKTLNGSSILSSFSLTHHIWHLLSDPIEITWGPLLVEGVSYEELITCANAPIGSNQDVPKVLLVLCSITSQIKEWRQTGWDKFVYQLILYGDGYEDDQSKTSVTEGKGHLSISKFLSVLYDLDEFTHNCGLLITNCIQQLGSLFKDSKPHVVSITGLNFPTVFLELANLLSLLVVLDEVIASQSSLQEHWTKYRRMIKSVRADSLTFDTDSSELLKLEKDLTSLNTSIMSGNLFQSVLDRVLLEFGKKGLKSSTLAEKFSLTLTLWSENLEKDFQEDPLRPLALTSLFLFVQHLFPQFDGKRLFQKTIWEHLKKIPAIPIAGSILWIPETFLNNFSIPPNSNAKIFDSKTLQNLANARHSFLTQKVQSLAKEVLNSHFQVGVWSSKLQETFYSKDRSQLRLDDLSLRSSLLTQGVKLSQHLSQSFKLILNLHAQLARPVTKQSVGLLCGILQLLKTIQSTFHRFNVHICESASAIVQNVMHIGLCSVNSLKSHFLSLRDPRRVDETRSDTLAVLTVLENVLKGSPSKKRLLVAEIAFEWVTASYRLWREEDNSGILAVAIERIKSMVELQENIRQACNGSAVYWHRVILSSFFSSAYNEQDSGKLSKMFLVLNDCLHMLGSSSPYGEEARNYFIQEVEACFRVNLVDKLVRDVETDLRLSSHSHLNVQQSNGGEVKSTAQGTQDYNNLLDIPSLVFNDHRINLKFVAENYLTKTFYNLASVALHDWQSYANMRVLALDKYDLNIIEDHLPGHTLEQGLDILEIVRNLGKFVTEFSYNLNNQVFVQVTSPNKHLDTVNIRHLANSMRTHGPGLIATTVNFTYLYLRAKIHSFSQFLYDEQIKSRLAREIRLFKQGRQQEGGRADELTSPDIFPSRASSGASRKHGQQQSFPYDRVLKFQRGIRNLGSTPEGLSPLDQFRILVTHIGNALGFVRLVRSGQLHFVAGGCRFVSDLDDVPNFTELSEESVDASKVQPSLWEELKVGGENVDFALKSLSVGADGVDYLRLLANGFSGPCRNQANAHLKHFYVIVPALTLSYVDHMRSCKEKLLKKAQGPTIFTDDGFPMGVAFLLNVLGQDQEFDSLQWFSGLTQRLTEERQKALTAIQDSKKDEKLQQANTLTAKRLLDSLQEFQLLRYNLSSARIFFQQHQL